MPIDILNETLMPLSAVPAFLESRGVVKQGGGRLTTRTVFGWVASGKLEATPGKILGAKHTSEEAIQRMFLGESNDPQKSGGSTPRKRQRTRRDREREHEAAMERLRKEGVV